MSTLTLDEAIERYTTALQDTITAHYAAEYTKLDAPVVSVQRGRTYARIVLSQYGGQRSVHTFVALVDVSNRNQTAKAGDILKDGGWKGPAPRGVRGSVYDADPLQSVSTYGAKYIN